MPSTTDCQNEGVNTSLIYAVTNDLAPILTFSYGACESTIAAYASSTLEPILKQANAQGQTVLVSSGDSGAATCDQGTDAKAASQGLTVSYPASSVYVTAVGGTQISDIGWSASNNSYGGSATGYTSEQAWNDTVAYGTLAASGGGVSKIFSKPDWQVGTTIPQDGHRDVPDVAFAASVVNVPYIACTTEAPCQNSASFGGTSTIANGGLYGGTSLSAPNFAAMLAVIEQKNAGSPLGNINPLLYALAQGSSASTVFHDVSNGSNVVPCVLGTPDCGETNTFRTIGYTTITGYDQVTGLGSLSATGFAAALTAKALPLRLTTSPTTPIVDQPVTFAATLLASSPAPTGTVTFSLNGTAVSSAIQLTGTTASFTYSGFTVPFGYFTNLSQLVATYSGDSTYSASSSTLTVEATRAPVTLTITDSAVNTLQTNVSTTFSITAVGQYGTPGGYVLLMVDGNYVANALSPLPLVNGVATYTYAGFSSAGVHNVVATYFSEADKQNFLSHPAGYVYPYTSYEGGSFELDLQVGSSGQTLIPGVTVTSASTGVLAPSDYAQVVFQVSGNGPSVPTGGYTYAVDGASTIVLKGGLVTATGFTASFQFGANWTPGTHTVQFMYDGDNNYKPSATVSVSFTVVAPAFALAVSPSTITIPNGGSGSATLTVNAGATYSGSTTFKLNLLSYTGAAFSGCFGLTPSTAISQRGTPVSLILTMYSGTTHCASGSRVAPLSATAKAPRETTFSIFIASLGFVGCLAFRRRRMVSRLLLTFVSISLICSVGCGGSSTNSGGSGGGITTNPTLTGTYVLQVTGTSGTDGSVTAKTTFTLIVQ